MKWLNFLICMFIFCTGFASEGTVQVPVSKTLNEQYRSLSADADLVDGFRMMKLYKMDQFWKVVLDSIQKKQTAIHELQVQTARLDNEIASLKTTLDKSNSENVSLTRAVGNLIVFGKPYSKTAFVSVMIIALVALMAVAVILLFMYRVAFGKSHEFRKLNEELYKEFDEYKHQAVEKQIKLSREMQDYRNKLEELKVTKSF